MSPARTRQQVGGPFGDQIICLLLAPVALLTGPSETPEEDGCPRGGNQGDIGREGKHWIPMVNWDRLYQNLVWKLDALLPVHCISTAWLSTWSHLQGLQRIDPKASSSCCSNRLPFDAFHMHELGFRGRGEGRGTRGLETRTRGGSSGGLGGCGWVGWMQGGGRRGQLDNNAKGSQHVTRRAWRLEQSVGSCLASLLLPKPTCVAVR